MLNNKGQCCGRKPIVYKGSSYRSPQFPQRFCARCDRAYDLKVDKQIENWAWKKGKDGEFYRIR